MSDSFNDQSPAPALKRKRVALACNACRSRKSRCNGARPHCSMCSAAGFECIYEPTDSSTNIIIQKEYVLDLTDRVQALEAAIAKHGLAIQDHEKRLQTVGSHPSPQTTLAEGAEQRRCLFGEGRSRNEDLGQTPVSIASADHHEPPSEGRVTDGMAISFVSEADTGHFGPTSNISLLRHISQAVASLDNFHDASCPDPVDNLAPLDSGIISTARPSPPANANDNNDPILAYGDPSPFILPSEVVTRELMAQYFSNTGLLYPYIHEPSFCREYDELVANGFKKARRTWLALLHMVLAMSSSTLVVDTKEERQKRNLESSLFYARAVKLCDLQTLQVTSLETVQYLLLRCHYLQGTQSSLQTWTTHGLAVKAALSLGLHSIDASKNLPRHDQELRKRAWYGCVVLDRMLSMTFGRPAIIPHHFIRLPLPEDFSVAKPSQDATLGLVSAQFFGGTVTLMNVLHEVIADLYGYNLGCDPPLGESEMLDRVFRLDRTLGNWELDLPLPLSLLQAGEYTNIDASNTAHLRFRTILTLRKLNLETLIHRPALIQTMEAVKNHSSDATTSRSVQRMRQSSISSCVTAAESTIYIIHQVTTARGPKNRLLGAWWFSLYFVFNASLVVFANLLVSLQLHKDGPASIQRCDEYLLMAVKALRSLDAGNMVIKICDHRLSQLRQILQSLLRATRARTSIDGAAVGYVSVHDGYPLDLAAKPSDGGDGGFLSRAYFSEEMMLMQDGGLELSQFCLPGDLTMFFGDHH